MNKHVALTLLDLKLALVRYLQAVHPEIMGESTDAN